MSNPLVEMEKFTSKYLYLSHCWFYTALKDDSHITAESLARRHWAMPCGKHVHTQVAASASCLGRARISSRRSERYGRASNYNSFHFRKRHNEKSSRNWMYWISLPEEELGLAVKHGIFPFWLSVQQIVIPSDSWLTLSHLTSQGSLIISSYRTLAHILQLSYSISNFQTYLKQNISTNLYMWKLCECLLLIN